MRTTAYKRSHHFHPFLLLLCILTTTAYALKCRTEDAPSDAELKRVARTCMHKVSEGTYNKYGSHSSSTGSTGTGYTSTNQNSYGQQNYGQNSNGKTYGNGADDGDDNDGQNYRGYTFERNDYNDDMLRQRNRERMQNTNRSGRSRRGAMTNNYRSVATNSGRYDQSNTSNNGRGSNSGGGSGGGGSSSSNGNSSNNQRSSNSNSGSSSGNNSNNNNNNNNYNNSSSHDRDHQSDGACIVHCFFEEMNMLNSDDYPDKHKVSYLLTKDLRDRELRAFYTETIQDCFHYLDSQRRRDKCQFSRELISCMTEYAKANCDDWEDYNIMFN